MSWPDIKRIIQPYLVWTVMSIEPGDIQETLGIAERNGLSYWDALVVRAATKANAAFILTEDLNPGQRVEGIEIINPFRN